MSAPDARVCLADPEPSCPEHGYGAAPTCTCPPGAHGPVAGCRAHRVVLHDLADTRAAREMAAREAEADDARALLADALRGRLVEAMREATEAATAALAADDAADV